MPFHPVPDTGNLRETFVADILAFVYRERKTGALRVERESFLKTVYIQDGHIAYATSNAQFDRLGEVLIRHKMLTPEQLEDAIRRLQKNVSLGKMLVQLGYLSPKELIRGVRLQARAILDSIFQWEDGTYHWIEGSLPKQIVDLRMPVPTVVIEGCTNYATVEWVRRWLPENHVVRAGLKETFFQVQPELELRGPIEEVITWLDGQRTIEDIAKRTGAHEFFIAKIVCALHILDLADVTLEPLPIERGDEGVPETAAGVASGAEMTEISGEEIARVVEAAIPATSRKPPAHTEATEAAPPAAVETPTAERSQPSVETGAQPAAPAPAPQIPVTPQRTPTVPVRFQRRDRARRVRRRQWVVTGVLVVLAVLAVGTTWWFLEVYTPQRAPVAPETPQPAMAPAKVPSRPAEPAKIPPEVTVETLPTPTGTPVDVAPPSPESAEPPESAPAPARPAPATTPSVAESPPPTGAPEPSMPEPAPVSESSVLQPPETVTGAMERRDWATAARAAVQWLRAHPNAWTIQVELACQTDTLQRALREVRQAKWVYVLPKRFQGRDCFIVGYGLFPDRVAAEHARTRDLAEELLQQKYPPQVVPVQRILRLATPVD